MAVKVNLYHLSFWSFIKTLLDKCLSPKTSWPQLLAPLEFSPVLNISGMQHGLRVLMQLLQSCYLGEWQRLGPTCFGEKHVFHNVIPLAPLQRKVRFLAWCARSLHWKLWNCGIGKWWQVCLGCVSQKILGLLEHVYQQVETSNLPDICKNCFPCWNEKNKIPFF